MTLPAQDEGSAMEAEFDVVARWTREAVAELGPEHGIPAACRGSASPAALDWLARACGLRAGTRLVDVGGGMGGPAAYAARHVGARPLVVEPMPDAARTATAMLGCTAVVGSGDRVPVRAGRADAAWCLGVLCTVEDKAALLAELRRVLPAGGSLGLFVLVARVEDPPDPPDGNHFPTAARLGVLLGEAGFEVVDGVALTDLPSPDREWQDRVDRVEAAIEAAHGDSPRFAQARDQERRIAQLMGEGAISAELMAAVAR
ncbi:MAG: class I SAM-dependent methyltransferase [Pseudonocardia sp.]|nr:class I SAM-dependent methyltransferase [Pseudonocardia sp.]